jgi:phage FluMu gp28-like protein
MNRPAAQLRPAPAAVLLAYQQQWVGEKAEVAAWEKSRRIGASWCDASDSTLTSSEAGGMDSLYIGYSEDMTREYIEDVAMWAKHFHMVASEIHEDVYQDEKDIKAFRIDFASGSKALGLSSRPRSIRGKQGKVTIDEAAFHDDLPGLLKAALAMLIWGGRVRILSSHNGWDHPFNQMVQEVRAGKLPYALHRTTLDDALVDGLYQRICAIKGTVWTPEGERVWRDDLVAKYGDGADEELFCIPRESGGRWLSRTLIEARMYEAPVLRWEAPKGFETWPEHSRVAEVRDWLEAQVKPLLAKLSPELMSFLGEDFARSGDLTVMMPAQRERNLQLRVPFHVELKNVTFEQQRQILFYIIDRLPRFAAGALDARGNGQYLAEVAMQRYGASRIHQVMLSEPWYRENTAPFKAAFEDNTFACPRDADLLDDLRAFEVVKGVPRIPDRQTVGASGFARHGDAAIAALLCHFASRNPGAAIEYEGVAGRRALTAAASPLDFPDEAELAGTRREGFV